MKPYRKLRTENKDIRQLQDAVGSVLRDLDRDIVFGRIIKDIAITSGTTKEVEHLLDRIPSGFLVIYRSAGEVVFDKATHTDKILYLDASGNVTINIWVF
jgi:hypothetical protein